jgi:hypothetical protein
MRSFVNSTARGKRGAGHVARMRERINAYEILVGKPEGKRSLLSTGPIL